MAAGGHFGCPKITFDHISDHFRSIQNFIFIFTKRPLAPILDVRNSLLFFGNFDKMAAGAHFGCPKLTFDRISGHFRSIRNFIFFFGNV